MDWTEPIWCNSLHVAVDVINGLEVDRKKKSLLCKKLPDNQLRLTPNEFIKHLTRLEGKET